MKTIYENCSFCLLHYNVCVICVNVRTAAIIMCTGNRYLINIHDVYCRYLNKAMHIDELMITCVKKFTVFLNHYYYAK